MNEPLILGRNWEEIQMGSNRKVAEELAIRWLRASWDKVKALAPDQKKVWEGESCGNCCDDTPQDGLCWPNPKYVPYDSLEDINFSQEGDTGCFSTIVSTR